MKHHNSSAICLGAFVIGSAALIGCASSPDTEPDLVNRAYIISKDSDDLTVIDLDRLEVIGVVRTAGVANHMAELNADFTKVFVDSSETDETVVVDATRLAVTNRIITGAHPSHLSLNRDGSLLAVMNEGDDSVSFIDPVTETVVKELPGFNTPHFMRYSPDGRYGYVANIGAFHLTRVDLQTLEIDSHIPLDGHDGPPNATIAADQTGFADAQIDPDGILYAAHNMSARVLVYDTVAKEKIAEREVGPTPWIAYAEHPWANLPRHALVPAFGDRTVSLLRGEAPVMSLPAGDMESFGVNFTSLVPGKAFVMNRVREDITVVDTAQGKVTANIDTGGTTETASTTADGKWIVATVSSSNQVIVIDAVTNQIVKTFDNIGKYPWSVTIPRGQNYCH
jgi:DNA-binding beta-propeller fold protein YncE